MKTLLAALTSFLICANTIAAETPEAMFVKPANMNLLAAPAPDALAAGQVSPGDRVTVLERQAGFVNVQAGDGTQGWLAEDHLTVSPPADIRVAELEEENSGLQEQLSQLNEQINQLRTQLNRAQSQARNAETALNSAQNNSGERIAELEAANGKLKKSMLGAEAETQALLERVAQLEMAQGASRLLAESQNAVDESRHVWDWQATGVASGIGIALLLIGGIGGAQWNVRRLRRRYHGLEL